MALIFRGCVLWWLVPNLFWLQEDRSKQAVELIEQLRSSSIEERARIRKKLKELGMEIRPQLRKAAEDTDPEVSASARSLLRVFWVSERLTPGLMKALPDVDERLASGDDHTWTEVFLEASEERDGRPLHEFLKSEDLEPLAAPAVHGASGPREQSWVMSRAAARQLRSSAPEIAKLLKERGETSVPNIPALAAFNLGHLGVKDVAPELIACLRAKDPALRTMAARALGQLKAAEAAPELVRVLEETRETDFRLAAITVLSRLNATESIPALRKLLEHPDPSTRVAAAGALCHLGLRDGVPTLLKESEYQGQAGQVLPPLTYLNALRKPGSWDKLVRKSLKWKLDGSWGLEGVRKDILERIGKEAELGYEGLSGDWFTERERVQVWVGPTTLVEDLVMMLPAQDDVILEEDRIRVLTHERAVAFWLEWKKSQEK